MIAGSVLNATVGHAEERDARALAATCASCHQPTQLRPPPLAGEAQAALIARLRAFRDGSRRGTVMPQIAKGYTIDEIAALAAYYAQARSR